MSKTPGFRITSHRGFHITFENGYTVSVQFGAGNYCEHYNDDWSLPGEPRFAAFASSSDAETAVWGPDGKMIDYDNSGDSVQGYRPPWEVLALLNWASTQ